MLTNKIVPFRSQGIDTIVRLTEQACKDLLNSGITFAIRYLGLSNTALSPEEVDTVTGAGLGLMAVQYCREPGWLPTHDLGAESGNAAVHNASFAGLPAGTILWCDVEGVNDACQSSDVVAYINAWADVAERAGYVPGLYVGAQCKLTYEQLYHFLNLKHYWKSQSDVPGVALRGYQMIQLYPSVVVAGIRVDVNVVQKDYFGDSPTMVVKVAA